MEAVSTTGIQEVKTYATFWRRLAAYLIDNTIISIIASPIILWYVKDSGFWDLIMLAQKAQKNGLMAGVDNSFAFATIIGSFYNTILIMAGVKVIFDMLYYGLWESSKYQATPGKMACHLQVVNLHGERVSVFHGCARNFLKVLSNITLALGYLMAFVTEKHQALHDKLSGSYIIKTVHETPPIPGVQYAGFWRRFVAIILDGILLLILMSPLNMLLLSDSKSYFAVVFHNMLNPTDPWMFSIDAIIRESWVSIITSFIAFFYFASFESSRLQATPGKIALGIRVTDMLGQRLSFWAAGGRYVAKFVSQFTLFIGYIMAGITPKQQALHDELADTLVIVSPVPKHDM